MALFAGLGYLPSHENVLRVSKHSTKCVTGKRLGRRFVPGKYHPGVEAPGQRDPDPVRATEVARKVPRKNFAEFLVIRFGIQRGLLLPLAWLKIRVLLLNRATAK